MMENRVSMFSRLSKLHGKLELMLTLVRISLSCSVCTSCNFVVYCAVRNNINSYRSRRKARKEKKKRQLRRRSRCLCIKTVSFSSAAEVHNSAEARLNMSRF